MSIKLIYSVNQLNYIGKDNKLMWHIPEDLKYFKEVTTSDVVVMGRNTWDSLPEIYRPLPNRTNVVLSKKGLIKGAIVYDNLIEVFEDFDDRDIWVIGGNGPLEEAMDYADEVHLTKVFNYKEGDVKAPVIPEDIFYIAKEYPITKSGSDKFKIIIYKALDYS